MTITEVAIQEACLISLDTTLRDLQYPLFFFSLQKSGGLKVYDQNIPPR